MVVGTAGHIDHGKTALVKALTGIDADRLKEEKARGITIDLGFANLPIDAETTIGFVDVPGHERFIRNMLAGVGGIDAVLLVVAADESVMPQTREHLDICSLLHIPRGLMVLTKIDAVDRELADLVEIELHDLVKGTFLAGAPVLRVSSMTGEGIPALVEALRTMARSLPARDATQLFRLPVDRGFSMKGFGTVVSGTLLSGSITRDAEVEVLPGGHRARVRGIQVHGGPVERATAGQRTALNLQRIDLEAVGRGMVIVPPDTFSATTLFDVRLELLPSAPALVRRRRVRFHVGTAEVMGYAVLLGQDTLEPGGAAFAQVQLEEATFALPGDRFIVRQYSPMQTLGGGVILDARPEKHRRSEAGLAGRLAALMEAPAEDRIAAIAGAAGLQGIDVPGIVARLGIRAEEARQHLQTLAAASRVRLVAQDPPAAVAEPAFRDAADAIVRELTRFHDAEPLAPGLTREDLKGRTMRAAPAPVFRAVLEALAAEGRLELEQDLVIAAGRRVSLAPGDARVRDELQAAFRAFGLQAPAAEEVAAGLGVNRQKAHRILQLLLKEGTLVRVAEGLLVDAGALQELVQQVRARKAQTANLGVKEFKDLTGLSRKFALPLLEYLDAQRVTRRVGDGRLIL